MHDTVFLCSSCASISAACKHFSGQKGWAGHVFLLALFRKAAAARECFEFGQAVFSCHFWPRKMDGTSRILPVIKRTKFFLFLFFLKVSCKLSADSFFALLVLVSVLFKLWQRKASWPFMIHHSLDSVPSSKGFPTCCHAVAAEPFHNPLGMLCIVEHIWT